MLSIYLVAFTFVFVLYLFLVSEILGFYITFEDRGKELESLLGRGGLRRDEAGGWCNACAARGGEK